jgi:8-oxo-dGTP pyrophosphatase MutT (NUDIX family)
LDHHEVTRPDGNLGEYGVVHYFNKSVGVVALDSSNRVLLVGQYRYTIDRYSWEIPAGGCPENESHLAAAHRELQEETGFTTSSMRLLLHAHMSNSVSDEEAFCYLADDLVPGTASPEGTEDLQMMWLHLDEVLLAIRSGEITDALTILAVQQAAMIHKANSPG